MIIILYLYILFVCFQILQLLTAALIIYSTFAAIYYSKVNPIVSDYDYQDYLGGRSFPSDIADTQDSIDPGEDSPVSSQNTSSSSWLNSPWMTRTQYALQFILDSIEKPPKWRATYFPIYILITFLTILFKKLKWINKMKFFQIFQL